MGGQSKLLVMRSVICFLGLSFVVLNDSEASIRLGGNTSESLSLRRIKAGPSEVYSGFIPVENSAQLLKNLTAISLQTNAPIKDIYEALIPTGLVVPMLPIGRDMLSLEEFVTVNKVLESKGVLKTSPKSVLDYEQYWQAYEEIGQYYGRADMKEIAALIGSGNFASAFTHLYPNANIPQIKLTIATPMLGKFTAPWNIFSTTTISPGTELGLAHKAGEELGSAFTQSRALEIFGHNKKSIETLVNNWANDKSRGRMVLLEEREALTKRLNSAYAFLESVVGGISDVSLQGRLAAKTRFVLDFDENGNPTLALKGDLVSGEINAVVGLEGSHRYEGWEQGRTPQEIAQGPRSVYFGLSFIEALMNKGEEGKLTLQRLLTRADQDLSGVNVRDDSTQVVQVKKTISDIMAAYRSTEVANIQKKYEAWMNRTLTSELAVDLSNYLPENLTDTAELVAAAKSALAKAQGEGKIIDYKVAFFGDDLQLHLTSKRQNEFSPAVYGAAVDAVKAALTKAKEKGIYQARNGQDFFALDFNGQIAAVNLRPLEMGITEKKADPQVVFKAVNAYASVYNPVVATLLTDPKVVRGGVIAPSIWGFTVDVMDRNSVRLDGNGNIVYDTYRFDITSENFQFFQYIMDLDSSPFIAIKGYGKDGTKPNFEEPMFQVSFDWQIKDGKVVAKNPTLIVRTQGAYPATGEALLALWGPWVAPNAEGNRNVPIMPVAADKLQEAWAKNKDFAYVTAYAHSIKEGKIGQTVDVLNNPSWQGAQNDAQELSRILKRHGKFTPNVPLNFAEARAAATQQKLQARFNKIPEPRPSDVKKKTLTLIKADVGGVGGHTEPGQQVIGTVTSNVQGGKAAGVTTDATVFKTGDDVQILMSHNNNVDNPGIHKLGYDSLMAGGETAEKLGLYGAKQDLSKVAFSGNVRGLGPGSAEITLPENEKEAYSLHGDKMGPNAFSILGLEMIENIKKHLAAGGKLPPGVHGIAVRVQNLKSHEEIVLNGLTEIEDLENMLAGTDTYAIKSFHEITVPNWNSANPEAGLGEHKLADFSTDKLREIFAVGGKPKYVGKDDPVALFRVWFAEMGKLAEVLLNPWVVDGGMRGSHRNEFMPQEEQYAVPTIFDGPPIFSLLKIELDSAGNIVKKTDMVAASGQQAVYARDEAIKALGYYRHQMHMEPWGVVAKEYDTLPNLLKIWQTDPLKFFQVVLQARRILGH